MASSFQGNVEALLKGMDNFVASKTVVGEPTKIGNTTIVPLVDVTFGMASSAKIEDRKNNSGGGMGGKISPSAVLVIQDGCTRLINIKNQDVVNKIVDMAPDLLNRILPKKEKSDEEQQVEEAVQESGHKEEAF